MTADPLLTFFPSRCAGHHHARAWSVTEPGRFRPRGQIPKPVLIGLACQLLLLPLACFFLAKLFGLAPALAVGLMLLAASPGGTTANLYSHLAHGDVALNITSPRSTR